MYEHIAESGRSQMMSQLAEKMLLLEWTALDKISRPDLRSNTRANEECDGYRYYTEDLPVKRPSATR